MAVKQWIYSNVLVKNDYRTSTWTQTIHLCLMQVYSMKL